MNTPNLLLLLLPTAILLAWLIWYALGDPVEEPEVAKMHRPDITEIRERRLDELMVAYLVAKEELGEEPTPEQIILTRDTLRDL